MRTSLPEELHLEILKRLSPTPQVLARASASDDPSFIRELYRTRGGAPVTLGFFQNFHDPPRRFVHTDAGDPVRIALDSIDQNTDRQFMDCSHGRVFLRDSFRRFVVWDPMTGDHHILTHKGPGSYRHINAALICECAADDVDDDQKLGRCTPCHASHFRVAVMFNDSGFEIQPEHCVIGKTLYQLLSNYFVLAFDMEKQSLTVFQRPKWPCNVRLLKVDGGTLGLAVVVSFTLRLWLRCADAWVIRKTVDLRKILPGLSTPSPKMGPRTPPVKIIGWPVGAMS